MMPKATRFDLKSLPANSGQSRVIRALLLMMAAKHRPTLLHLQQVARYAELLATAIGMPHAQVKQVATAALLHDIGKVAVADEILTKPGRLTDNEMLLMSDHAEWGADILMEIGGLSHLSEAVRHHHEWYNGKGYPAGLVGEETPLFSRIIAVVDAFDTMTTTRPYRTGRTWSEALEELERCAGTQFDPELVKAFAQVVREAYAHGDLLVPRSLSPVGGGQYEVGVEPLALRLCR